MGYVVLGVAPGELVFGFFVTPLFWLMLSAFLLAGAVEQSGLADYPGAALVPGAVPASPVPFGLMVAAVTMAGHLFLGSSLSTVAILLPLLLPFGERGGWPPAETLRFALPLTVLVFLLVGLVEPLWWRVGGLLR